jgi:hypothetical protein
VARESTYEDTMPKLKRWLKAKRTLPVFSHELQKALTQLGVNMAGSDHEISETICVNAQNRETVITLLERHGFVVEDIEHDPS